MKNNFKNTIRNAKKLALSLQEKAEMKAALLRHIEANPAEAGVVWYETPKFFSMTFLGRQVPRVLVPAFVCVVVIGLGGATFASQASLPGDVLYPVKILNEKVESSLTFDPVSEAKLEEKHAITRLTEVEKLSRDGKLDEKKKAELTDAFNKSSEKAIERMGRVYDKDKEQGKKSFGAFKSNVKAKKDALRDMSGKEDDDFVRRLSSSTRTIAERIDNQEDEDTDTRESEEDESEDRDSRRGQDKKGRRQD